METGLARTLTRSMRAPMTGVLQVQFVDLRISHIHGLTQRQAETVPPTDVQQPGLARDGKLMVSVNHGFALSNPA